MLAAPPTVQLPRLNPQGGTEPYTFMWSNGSTDKTVTGGRGTYTAMVIDANGCIATTVVAIDEPSDACCHHYIQ